MVEAFDNFLVLFIASLFLNARLCGTQREVAFYSLLICNTVYTNLSQDKTIKLEEQLR